ncbi:ATP-binding protein [Actinocorallia sp. B10E7]|uniref:ATP-binding protein n=1 Tax=Actinocorallia sp. B10E7 TaxID=3153558 RepID=UPI00325D3CF0
MTHPVGSVEYIDYAESSLIFNGKLENVRIVRRVTRMSCENWGLAASVTDLAVLLASEVAGNAVAASPNEPIRVDLRFSLGIFRFECWDVSPEMPASIDLSELADLPIDEMPEDGRGNGIVELTAHECGWLTRPDRPGKARWFTLAATPAPDPSEPGHPGPGPETRPHRQGGDAMP